ncbi:FAS1 domain-containing protein [Paraphysoderma sedebokerense]|nr:FAS1 domain-containing protein [Paraphysoderma sedebokerense]
MMKSFGLLVTVAFTLLTTSIHTHPSPAAHHLFARQDPGPAQNTSIWQQLEANGNYSTFIDFVNKSAAEYIPILNGSAQDGAINPNITVFAPSNQAFQKLPLNYTNYANNTNTTMFLEALALYHVHTNGTVNSTNATTPTNITTAFQPFVLDLKPSNETGVLFFVNDAKVIKGDQNATNGVWHGIDQVLTPAYFLNITIPRSLPPLPTPTV